MDDGIQILRASRDHAHLQFHLLIGPRCELPPLQLGVYRFCCEGWGITPPQLHCSKTSVGSATKAATTLSSKSPAKSANLASAKHVVLDRIIQLGSQNGGLFNAQHKLAEHIRTRHFADRSSGPQHSLASAPTFFFLGPPLGPPDVNSTRHNGMVA